MNCSLSCYCDFFQAPTTERKRNIVRRYKDSQSGEAKGRSTYYTPVLNTIKGKLCPGGTVDEKIQAISKACIRSTYNDQQNQARIGSNLLVFHAFRSMFGNVTPTIFSSPRMQFLAGCDVAVNIQPDLYFEIDGQRTMVKLGVSKRSRRPESLVRVILQMLYRGALGRSLDLPISRLFFMDVRGGKTYVESSVRKSLESDLEPVSRHLNEIWNSTSL